MNLQDYLIDQDSKAWGKLLSDWIPPLPASFTLWLVNRFGDAFVVTDDGAVSMLDIGGGSFKRLAGSRDEFADLLDVDDNALNWLMIPLVDKCVAAGMTLQANQCYGFKQPPMLGGNYDVDNVEPTDLAVHYGLLGQIHQQTKDLPDGTPITRVIVEE
jgi:hypothetical protein